jgi:hypothetical protein
MEIKKGFRSICGFSCSLLIEKFKAEVTYKGSADAF